MRFISRPGRTRRVVKRTSIALFLLALSGAAYEQANAHGDRNRFPQIGRSIDIGGRLLNIYCSGEGNPTVVLLSGGGLPGYSWLLVQPQVGRITRACWYDRAGEGWSEPAPDTQTSFSTASDLHNLLQTAHVTGPYVLTGHSAGGFGARAFYRLYPNDVAGMVLVEPAHEDYDTRIHVGNAWCRRCPRRPALFLARALGSVGLFRLLASQPGPPPGGIKPEEWATIVGLQRQHQPMMAGQYDPRASEEQMRAAGGLGSVPLIVLTGGQTLARSDPHEAWEYAEAHRTWIELHAGLARLSTRGRHVIVEQSGHMMPYEAPEAVIGAVLDIVAEVRRNGSQRASASGTK
jgi:pimeloyl-ACP methyl ester carboxylesterase